MQGLKAAGVDVDYFLLDSEYGHSASGLDADKWSPRLRQFMERLDGLVWYGNERLFQ
jgi:homoserine O-acetyltransferase